jgi:hypothetical protein
VGVWKVVLLYLQTKFSRLFFLFLCVHKYVSALDITCSKNDSELKENMGESSCVLFLL